MAHSVDQTKNKLAAAVCKQTQNSSKKQHHKFNIIIT